METQQQGETQKSWEEYETQQVKDRDEPGTE